MLYISNTISCFLLLFIWDEQSSNVGNYFSSWSFVVSRIIREGIKKREPVFVVSDYGGGGGGRRKCEKTTKLCYKLYFFLVYSRMMRIYREISAPRLESAPPIFENPVYLVGSVGGGSGISLAGK